MKKYEETFPNSHVTLADGRWTLRKKCGPLEASSYIRTPSDIKKNETVVNIDNTGNDICFL